MVNSPAFAEASTVTKALADKSAGSARRRLSYGAKATEVLIGVTAVMPWRSTIRRSPLASGAPGSLIAALS